MKKILVLPVFILIFSLSFAQKPGEIYFNYDELIGIQVETDSTMKVYYNLEGKPNHQQTGFKKTEKGVQLGKLKYNQNPNVRKMSAEPLEFINGNLYLTKYRMFFYSDENRERMEKQDCYIVNNQIYITKKGKIRGNLKKAIKTLNKSTVRTIELDAKTTYEKYGIHCIGATEIFGIPL